MCKLVTETENIIKAMDILDPIGNKRHCITVQSFLNDYEGSAKKDDDRLELLKDTSDYREQFKLN
tara:strand:+ start:325 stop:519 length:195 start_codon:yes stop_codon:yes gene_type:complete